MADKMTTVKTPVFRASFVNVWKARKFDEKDAGEPKFGLTAVFTPANFNAKDKERWKAMNALADAVAMDKFKRKVKDLPANFKRPLRDGAEKPNLEGFGPGTVFCSLTTKRQPGIVGPDGVTRVTSEDQVYSGVYMIATVTCYPYDNKGKGVAFGLNTLMLVRSGKPLGGSSDPSKDFGEDELSAEDQEWLDKHAEDASGDDEGGF